MLAQRRSTWAATLGLAAAALLVTLVVPLAATGPAGAVARRASVTCSTTTAISYGANAIAGSIASAGADVCFTFTTAPR